MANGLLYEIPKFQRDYTWEEEHRDDLWNDIIALWQKEELEHYMGYLVLQSADNKLFQVIDGQQRIITLSIIVLAVLKCLKDLVEEGMEPEQNEERRNELYKSYIGYTDPETLIKENKLKLDHNSDAFYRRQLTFLPSPRELKAKKVNASERQMRDCFLWCYEKIKREFSTGVNLAKLIAILADKLFFTRLIVSDDLNAFKVFETLNARGVQLSAADLLKNYFFAVVDKAKPRPLEIDELEALWGNIIDKLHGKKLEDYQRYYWNSSNKTVRKRDLFKVVRKNIREKRQVFDLLRELDNMADVYIALQNPEDELWKGKQDVQNALRELDLFDIRQAFSLLLAAYRHLEDKDFIRLVEACAVVSFRYNVISGLNPNEQEEVYNKLAVSISNKQPFDLSALKRIYVPDESFATNFSLKSFKGKPKLIKYIFSKLEKHKYNNDISLTSDIYNIEHILPESASFNNIPGWEHFSDEGIGRSVDRLGNLTLLEKDLNKKAAAQGFADKKPLYAQSNSRITQALSKLYDDWDEEKLASRQKEMAKMAKEIWRLPIQ